MKRVYSNLEKFNELNSKLTRRRKSKEEFVSRRDRMNSTFNAAVQRSSENVNQEVYDLLSPRLTSSIMDEIDIKSEVAGKRNSDGEVTFNESISVSFGNKFGSALDWSWKFVHSSDRGYEAKRKTSSSTWLSATDISHIEELKTSVKILKALTSIPDSKLIQILEDNLVIYQDYMDPYVSNFDWDDNTDSTDTYIQMLEELVGTDLYIKLYFDSSFEQYPESLYFVQIEDSEENYFVYTVYRLIKPYIDEDGIEVPATFESIGREKSKKSDLASKIGLSTGNPIETYTINEINDIIDNL